MTDDTLTELDKAALLAVTEKVVDGIADELAFDAINFHYEGILDVIETIGDRHPERAQLLRRAMFHMDLSREGLA